MSIVLASVLGVAAASGAEGPGAAADTWYAGSVARGEGTFLIAHYWSKGARLRAETVAAGRRLITIVDGETYYIIDPTREDAVAIERSSVSVAGDAARERPFGDELSALLRAGGERVGEEEINGLAVERYQLTNDAGRLQVWVDAEQKLPVRIERYVRAAAARETVEYTGWMRGLSIADSFFAPPRDIEMERIGYEDFVRRSRTERIGPAPPFFTHLLHGDPVE